MITKSRIDDLLFLDKESWSFYWKNPTSPRTKKGSIAGTINPKGYLVITIDKKLYIAHRLIWFYVNGKFPDNHIDHIDRNKLNNNPDNLRNVTPQENNQNITSTFNKNGLSGISKTKAGKYVAKISIGKSKKHIGTFSSAELAHAAYIEAKRKHHPLFTINSYSSNSY